ncbi:MAG: carbon storage regulator [Candidatus Neomarinimicrobiota bacterium]|nr:carbon storage regulator CsrA [Candidatus Neomarinimicrobiota bacterium]RKY48943.1 MAG: carbon storage regulator [Candidatus Neomarinimicrobiota bacterium]RKY51902.1 MAG: carbon storage regulator [Candidatus Neomarinimicrobiota bacterium]HDN60021.1 carbon storage regulator [Candidatus Neomarinimicrobiota bacterium]
MLVLTRKCNETIRIGSNIKVKVLEVSGSYVKIGIEAPLEIPVYREELYQKILEENRASLISRELDGQYLKEVISRKAG